MLRALGLAFLIVALLGVGCAAAGAAMEDGGTSAGTVATTLAFGPGYGFLSAFVWKLLFGWWATEATGTSSTRVDAAGEEVSGMDGVPDPLGITMFDSPLFWIVLGVAFFAFGGPAWVRAKAAKIEKKHDAWSGKQDSELERMRQDNAQMRKELDKLWSLWNNRPQ